MPNMMQNQHPRKHVSEPAVIILHSTCNAAQQLHWAANYFHKTNLNYCGNLNLGMVNERDIVGNLFVFKKKRKKPLISKNKQNTTITHKTKTHPLLNQIKYAAVQIEMIIHRMHPITPNILNTAFLTTVDIQSNCSDSNAHHTLGMVEKLNRLSVQCKVIRMLHNTNINTAVQQFDNFVIQQ